MVYGSCELVMKGDIQHTQAQIRQDVRKDTQRSQESKTGRSIPKSAASIEGASFSSLGLPCTPNSLGVSEKEYTLADLPLPLLNAVSLKQEWSVGDGKDVPLEIALGNAEQHALPCAAFALPSPYGHHLPEPLGAACGLRRRRRADHMRK